VVILVLLNLSAWLLGKKVDPVAQQGTSAAQIEIINAAKMSVIQPSQEMPKRKVDEALAFEEESLAQLKVDKRGQVLRAPSDPNADKPKPVEIVALNMLTIDDSSPKMPAAPVQKPEKPPKVAVSEPAPAPAPVAPQPTPEVPAQVVLKCYRLGPFNNQNSLASVRRTLESGGITYTVDERTAAKDIKAVRVYLGAYASTAALEAETKRLKQMKIDHYVVTLNGTPVIQLGYFSEPARANTYQKTLKQKGIDAKKDTIYREARIDSWLDVQEAAVGTIKGLDLPAGARMKEQACR
jgi:cell division septation protein DedD